jgi:hypothetical protein
LCGEPTTPVCINCGVPLIVLHILAECPLYDGHFITFHFHGTFFGMLTDDCQNISNALAFLDARRLAWSV